VRGALPDDMLPAAAAQMIWVDAAGQVRRYNLAYINHERIPEEAVVTFGDPVELVRALTPSRLELVAAVKEKPDSIQGIADRLHRDRSAVSRDLQALIDAGIVLVEKRVLPGHGADKSSTDSGPRCA